MPFLACDCTHNRPYNDSVQHVQSRRCCIHISEALLNQLREFEAIYKNRTAAPARDGWEGKNRQHELDGDETMTLE